MTETITLQCSYCSETTDLLVDSIVGKICETCAQDMPAS